MIGTGFNSDTQSFPFPSQRVSDAEKEKPDWYATCCDWIIAQGMAVRDTTETEIKYGVLHGRIPDDFYKKTLNPYNSTNKKFLRFPATMRNYDMIRGIIRRYIGEYIKNPHDFIVTASNPDVVLARNVKLREELAAIVEQQIAARIQQSYAEFVNGGGNPQEFNPQQSIDLDKFIAEFNEKFIDDVSVQGQDVLNVIDKITEASLLYARAYFDFITFGECYTYSDVQGNNLIKRNVPVRDAFPVPNNEMFAEDFDMFAERMKMSYQQIIDNYDQYLDKNQREFLDSFYARYSVATPVELRFDVYNTYFPDVCDKFTAAERQLFKTQPNMMRDLNADLYDVWHVVWRGERRMSVVTYRNEVNLIAERLEDGNYKLNPEAGDIKIEHVWEPQVYESVRIGTRQTAIYPYKARAIAYNRKGKLPYNGLCELIPGYGKFSIIDLVLPYQVFYNIVAYHREMILAKNKLSILLIAKSLLGSVPEDTIYKMLADGVLYIDDENDQGMLKAQQVRMLNASMGEYIKQLTELMMDVELAAKNQVDMTPQRYGDIAGYAGKGTTEEAIARGSMGSVVIEHIFDAMRERDCARDLDYSKLAWIDGLNTAFKDHNNKMKYISLDVNKHVYADYTILAQNSVKEAEKLEQLKAFAFNAGQNGDVNIAVAAIMGDNVASIKKLIDRYQNANREHELQVQQLEQQTAQLEKEAKLEEISHKAEEDRKTLELKALLDQEIELIRADANMLSYSNDTPEAIKQAAAERLNNSKIEVEREKLNATREATMLDAFSKAEDRQVKREDIAAKIQIAKTNKNKYDSKSKSKK
jgi:RNase adaptor protein for sRNA GlmZ degradation